MRISRKARIPDILMIGILLFTGGCAFPEKPRLSADAQAEALSHLSLGLLAEANGDSAAALEHFETAVRLDPAEERLYAPAVAMALKLQQAEHAVQLAQTFAKHHPETPGSGLLLARVFALTDQPGRAEALFKKTAADFPDSIDAALFLARFYFSQDHPEEALRILRSDVFPPGGNEEQLHLLGILCMERARGPGDTAEARAAALEGAGFLRQALALNPEAPALWQQLAFALIAAQKPDEALDALREARIRSPGDPALARYVLDLLIRTGEFTEAMAACETLSAETGTAPELWFQYLAEQLPKESLPQLTGCMENHIREQPRAGVFYYTQLSSLYIESGDHQAAEDVLLRGLELYPSDSRLRIVLGYLLLQKEQYSEAYAELEQVRTGSPEEEWSNNPFFLFNLLVAAQKSDHLQEAARTLSATYTNHPVVLNQYMLSLLTGRSPVSTESAIDLLNIFHTQSPEAAEALYYLMALQAEQKNYAEAIQSAQRFEILAQKNSTTNLLGGPFYYQYAALYERTGRLEDAERLFYKAIDLGEPPLAAAAQNYIAYMWAERGEKLETGLALIRKALAVEPDNGAFLDTLGWIYYMQGRYEEALHELQRAKDIAGENNPEIWEHLGDTWLKLGHPDEASNHWKKALELDPESERLIKRLEANRITQSEHPAPADSPADTPPRP